MPRERSQGFREAVSRLKVAGVFFLFSLSFATSVFAKQHAVDDLTGVESWQFSVDGVTVSLTQILPDQVRAFYVNRGFEVEVIEPYALSCVFMTVLRNDAARGVVALPIERLAGDD